MATSMYMTQYAIIIHNTVLRDHIATSQNNATCRSPTIQKELLDLAANQILKSIFTNCNNGDCFIFIADESTDVRIKEQITMCPICAQETRR